MLLLFVRRCLEAAGSCYPLVLPPPPPIWLKSVTVSSCVSLCIVPGVGWGEGGDLLNIFLQFYCLEKSGPVLNALTGSYTAGGGGREGEGWRG